MNTITIIPEHKPLAPRGARGSADAPEAALDSRQFYLDCGDHFDRMFAAAIAAGLDADEVLAELRIALTQSCIHAQKEPAP